MTMKWYLAGQDAKAVEYPSESVGLCLQVGDVLIEEAIVASASPGYGRRQRRHLQCCVRRKRRYIVWQFKISTAAEHSASRPAAITDLTNGGCAQ